MIIKTLERTIQKTNKEYGIKIEEEKKKGGVREQV
jgi:hypothetical protein